MNVTIRKPTHSEFEKIKAHISEFELDSRELAAKQFIAAFISDELVGFGRLRHHSDCVELCSLGVITPLRNKGIGKAIVAELVRIAHSDIYLVCIIPEFFLPFGFSLTKTFPPSINSKLDYCGQVLTVPEKYVVMFRKEQK